MAIECRPLVNMSGHFLLGEKTTTMAGVEEEKVFCVVETSRLPGAMEGRKAGGAQGTAPIG
jgi:hypothetical protein